MARTDQKRATAADSSFVDGSPLFLAAARALKYFSTRELAEHAGLSVAAAWSFIRRSDVIGRMHGGDNRSSWRQTPLDQKGPGRREVRFRLLPERQDEVDRYLAGIARAVTPQNQTDVFPSSATSLIGLLDGSIKALQQQQPEAGSEEYLREVGIARRDLDAAQADIDERRSLSLPISQAEETILANAANVIARCELSESLAPKVDGLPGPLIAVVDDQLRASFRHFLEDWTAERPLQPLLEFEIATNLLKDIRPGRLIDYFSEPPRRTKTHEEILDDAWSAGASLLRLRAAWSKPWLKDITTELAEHLTSIERSNSVRSLPTLAVVIATIDARSLAGMLARALLNPATFHFKEPERQTCALALARLARPDADQMTQECKQAAAASFYLFNLSQNIEDDFPAIVPAALMLPHTDTSGLLIRLGKIIFDAHEIDARFRDRVCETAILRNIAIVLCYDGFQRLDRHFERLVDSQVGRTMLFLLKRAGALEWREENNGRDVIVMLGESAAVALGEGERTRHMLEISGETARERIRKLQTAYSFSLGSVRSGEAAPGFYGSLRPRPRLVAKSQD